MKAQRYPIRLHTQRGPEIFAPDSTIVKVEVGAAVFTPPISELPERGLNPYESSALIMSALGFTALEIGDRYDTTERAVKALNHRARSELDIPNARAVSRTILGLGATVLSRDNPINAKAPELEVLDELSQGYTYNDIDARAAGVSARRPSRRAQNTTNLIKEQNPGQRTNLLITRAFLSGQIPLDGLQLPPTPQTDAEPKPAHVLNSWQPNNTVAPDGSTEIRGFYVT